MVKVRPAQHEDVPAVVDLGARLHAESDTYREFPYSRMKARAIALRCLGSLMAPAEDAVLLVAEDEGRVVGMLGGYLSDGVFVDDMLVATDFTFYVEPKHRGTMAAVRLVKMFELWARTAGATHISPGISTRIEDDRTQRFYERLGYAPSGVSMMKRIK